MRNALQHLATKIIISHNHPSGNLKPSVSDKNTTQKVKAACQLFDIQLIDHLIISDQGYFSFADQGLL
jgi:DNA repair protein RadC